MSSASWWTTEKFEVEDYNSLIGYYEEVRSGSNVVIRRSVDIQELNNEFYERLGPDLYHVATHLPSKWGKHTDCESLAPYWDYFAEKNLNWDVPVDIENEDRDDKNYREALEELSSFTGEKLQKMFGESIILYRGLDKRDFVNRRRCRPTIEHEILEHKPVESWTIEPRIASQFGRIVLRKEADVEDVVASHFTLPYFMRDEMDFLVESEGPEAYCEDEIVRTEDFDSQDNAEWVLSNWAES